MSPFNRFLVKHKALMLTLLFIIVFILYFVFYQIFELPRGIGIIIMIVIMFFPTILIASAQDRAMRGPITEMLENGDPEPLLLVTEELLRYKTSSTIRQVIEINHCVALRECGRLQEAYDKLIALNLDATSTNAQLKIIYYNNLADICGLLEDNEQAELWTEKAIQLFERLPNSTVKKSVQKTILLLTSDSHIRNGRYDEAMQVLAQINIDSNNTLISVAAQRAQICYETGNFEEAKAHLFILTTNGNKRYCVTFAKKMLEKIENQN